MAVRVRKGQRPNEPLDVIRRSAFVSHVPYSANVGLAVNARFRRRSAIFIVILPANNLQISRHFFVDL
jgi:hypothetical protein